MVHQATSYPTPAPITAIPAPNSFTEMIRRVRRISRLKKNKSSPNLKGKVLGSNGNKYETFVADTGTPVSIISFNIAKKNGIKWYELDPDEQNYSGITGNQLSILGQTTITIKFTTIKRTQVISALVCREEGEESLIDLDTLKEMGVVHEDFPLPMDPFFILLSHK